MGGFAVSIVRTGTANTASVKAAFERAGAAIGWAETPDEVRNAPLLVLPGVGTFLAASGRLESMNLIGPLRERIRGGRPLLCICLGLQLLAQSSEESPNARGIGVIDERVTRFSAGTRVPQFGWNRVSPDPRCRLIEPGYAYFANSYKLDHAPQDWARAVTDHGGPFVSALEKGPVLACQFHPELSGRWGLALIRRWIDLSLGPGEAIPC